MRINLLIIQFLAIILCIACNSISIPKTKPTSNGAPGKFLCIAQYDILATIEDNLPLLLGYDSMLNFPEKNIYNKFEFKYNVQFATEKEVDNPILEHANLIVVTSKQHPSALAEKIKTLKPNWELGAFQLFKNVFSQPQSILVVNLEQENETPRTFKTAAIQVQKALREAQVNMGLYDELKPDKTSDSLTRLIQAAYHIQLPLPSGFNIVQSNTELCWIFNDNNVFVRHLFINFFSDSVAIQTLEQAIENRNYFTKKYIKNSEGTRTRVSESSLFPIQWQEVSIHGKTVKVLRGWYTEEGQFKRGVFLRYFFHDKSNKRYVAVDGILFAPEIQKNQQLRALETIIENIIIGNINKQVS